MADIELVIKMPEEDYKHILHRQREYCITTSKLEDVIASGTPLPKGHGRIGDLDAVMSDIYTSINRRINIGMMVDSEWLWGKLNDAIYNAPTIIETDKEMEG